MFASHPLPASFFDRSGNPCGCRNSTAPNSSAFAQTGWNRGSEKLTPSMLVPIAAPRRPLRIASSSCFTARSGYCSVNDAKAANRSGCAVHSSASRSLWMATILAAVSRSFPYQNGLIESTSMSMAIASIAASRRSTPRKCSGTPLVGGIRPVESDPIRSSASWK